MKLSRIFVGQTRFPLLFLLLSSPRNKIVNQLNQRLCDLLTSPHDTSISREPHLLTLGSGLGCPFHPLDTIDTRTLQPVIRDKLRHSHLIYASWAPRGDLRTLAFARLQGRCWDRFILHMPHHIFFFLMSKSFSISRPG